MSAKLVKVVVAGIPLALAAAGCASGSSGALPAADPALRENPRALIKQATTRPYPADAAKGEKSPVQAEIDYQLGVINFVNLGDTEIKDLQVWVNGQYSARLTALPVKRQLGVSFALLFDKQGKRPPKNGVWAKQVELLYDGKLYTIRTRAAD